MTRKVVSCSCWGLTLALAFRLHAGPSLHGNQLRDDLLSGVSMRLNIIQRFRLCKFTPYFMRYFAIRYPKYSTQFYGICPPSHTSVAVSSVLYIIAGPYQALR
jgi:hypothetical protein